jgi:flavorubredoxin
MSVQGLVLTGAMAILAGVVGAVTWYWYGVSREVASQVEVLNPGGDRGTALVVYHRGRRRFLHKVISAFAEGLVSSGWRVESTTASSQAPADLTGYDLLVLGGQTYFWSPVGPIRDYVSKLGDLGGKPTVIIITGFGATGRSISIMERLVQGANGQLVRSLSLTTVRPNDEEDPRPNEEVAVEMATRAGREIALPGQ